MHETRLQQDDLETVDSYNVTCSECRRATLAYESWADALDHAHSEGFRRCNDDTYCSDCLPIVQQRWEEEDENE